MATRIAFFFLEFFGFFSFWIRYLVELRSVNVVYKLSLVSILKQCYIILISLEQLSLSQASGPDY